MSTQFDNQFKRHRGYSLDSSSSAYRPIIAAWAWDSTKHLWGSEWIWASRELLRALSSRRSTVSSILVNSGLGCWNRSQTRVFLAHSLQEVRYVEFDWNLILKRNLRQASEVAKSDLIRSQRNLSTPPIFIEVVRNWNWIHNLKIPWVPPSSEAPFVTTFKSPAWPVKNKYRT